MTVVSSVPAIGMAPVEPIVPEHSGLARPAAGFADLLVQGLNAADTKVAHADALLSAFAAGDAVPVHQVTLALEQARLSVELAVQVRTRLLEAYRDFMSMQL